MNNECIECGKKLKPTEKNEGFCFYCQIKINNDFRIINEFEGEGIFAENIFEN
jgi:hypothetical protein